MIRFTAANRLPVEIDYRDKQGNRSTRAIEAYSIRRSQAGGVLPHGGARGQRAVTQLSGR
jgi:hypothetical protein